MGGQIYCYLRISSRKGNDISIDRQKEVISRYISQNNLNGEVVYLEEQKRSGTDANRPEYNALLAAIDSGKASTVIIYSLCRLTRDIELQSAFIKKVLKCGVKFLSINDNINLIDPSPEDHFLVNLHGSLNELYSKKISHRLRLAWKHHDEKGLKKGGKIPYGFDVGEDRKLIPNKKEQQIIRLVHGLHSEGKTLREIARHLMKIGAKTKSGLPWWNSKTIKNLIDRNIQANEGAAV